MTRTFLLACLLPCVPLHAAGWQKPPVANAETQGQTTSPAKTLPGAARSSDEEDPPEEDESRIPEKFVLNPLESERNIRVGNYYWRKKKFIAAAKRYEFATKFNPSSAEAFFKLGEAEQKLKHKDAAQSCFQKVMQLVPDSKLASEARRKIGSKG